MERLKDLQRTVEGRVRQLMEEAGRTVENREILEAEVPFYSDEPFWLLKLQAQDLEVWIYDNEFSFSSKLKGGGLELADYEDEEEYVEAIAEQIKGVL